MIAFNKTTYLQKEFICLFAFFKIYVSNIVIKMLKWLNENKSAECAMFKNLINRQNNQ